MKYKVYFASNARRVVEADHYVYDDKLLVFMRDGTPVLTAILANVTCFYPADETNAPSVPLMAQCGGFTAKV
jgi:hypothetical protein